MKKITAILFSIILMATLISPLFAVAGPVDDGWSYTTNMPGVGSKGDTCIIAFTANNDYMLCVNESIGDYDTVSIYNTSDWSYYTNLTRITVGGISSIACDQNNTYFAVGLKNGTFYVYWQSNFTLVTVGAYTYQPDIGTRVSMMEFSHDNTKLAVGGRASNAEVWLFTNPDGNSSLDNWETTPYKKLKIPGVNDDMQGGADMWSANDTYILGGRNGLYVWNVDTRLNVTGSPFGGANARGGSFSPDGKWMVHSYINNATVEIYSQQNLSYAGNITLPNSGYSVQQAFSYDSNWLAVAHQNLTDTDQWDISIYRVGTWDNSTWTLNTTFYNATARSSDMGFDRNSEYFAFADYNVGVTIGINGWVWELPELPEEEVPPGTCTSTGYTFGNWSHSEHVDDTGNLEHDWYFEDYDAWTTTDESSWWAGNYTLTFDGTSAHSYAVFNSSGLNRTQRFGWTHSNDSEPDLIYPYIIFYYHNTTDFDCVAWSSSQVWVMHWDGSNMIDIATGDTILNPYTDATDIGGQLLEEGYYLIDSGHYWKVLYNAINGSLKFKWWGSGFMAEPTGWSAEYRHANITHTDCGCQGVGVWNFNVIEEDIQWDLLNVWQLNYTINASAWINVSDTNTSRPHMDFPVIDLSEWSEEIMSYFNATADGDVSIDDIRDIMKNNITNPMSMESRLVELKSLDNGQQNDTVYYYSCVIDNFTEFSESSYDEWLHLQVQMCPEDDIETGEYGDFIVGIDVDNNRLWDANDRIYRAFADDTYDVTYWTLNGNGDLIEDLASWNVWKSGQAVPGNLHRYGSHLNYAISIPLADLVKTGGTSISNGDVFGLSIATTTSGVTYTTQDACIWQNWNETNEAIYYTEENNWFNAETYFFNCVGEGGYLPNVTTLLRWGEGELGDGMVPSGEIFYNLSIEKTANITYTQPGSTYARVNYTIWVNNTGAGTLTGIVVNDTKFNCSCHDFNETEFIYTNVPWANVTNQTCTRLFTHASLAQGESWQIIYSVNLSNCSGVTTGTIQNNATVNATQIDTAVTANHQISWGSINRLCVSYTSDLVDVQATGNSVFTIIGIVFIIGAILLIIGLVSKYGIEW